MPWSWSHSQDAYDDLRENLHNKPTEWLETVFAEWEAAIPHGPSGEPRLDTRRYARALKKAKKLTNDVLADAVYDKAEEQGLCARGGHKAWCCPFGCGPHLTYFDHEMTDEEITAAAQKAAAQAEWENDDDEEEEN